MSEALTKKNIKLSIQFDNYLAKNPELLEQIPNKATVILTVKGDYYFNRISRSFTKNLPKKWTQNIVEARKEGSKWKILLPS